MITNKKYAGVDVSKSKLDVNFKQGALVAPNQPAELKAMLRQLLDMFPGIHFVCEPTGGYELPLVECCHEAGVPVSVVNPKKIRDFAGAKGQLAKTDEIDARTIREFGEVFDPLPEPVPSENLRRLSAAVRRKAKLTAILASEKTTLDKISDAFVKNDLEVNIRHLKRRLAECEKQIQNLIASDADFVAKKRQMEQVKGVGPGLSSVLIAEMPELGAISDKKVARLVGVAPLNRDSGKWRGTRTIHGGRSLVRRSLYMPALTAAMHNPILKAFYQRLRAKNKPHHVAITAVIRKMICLINRVLSDPTFTPAK